MYKKNYKLVPFGWPPAEANKDEKEKNCTSFLIIITIKRLLSGPYGPNLLRNLKQFIFILGPL